MIPRGLICIFAVTAAIVLNISPFQRFKGIMNILILVALLFIPTGAMAQTETMTASLKTISSVTVSLEDGCSVNGVSIPCEQNMVVSVDGVDMTYEQYLEFINIQQVER